MFSFLFNPFKGGGTRPPSSFSADSKEVGTCALLCSPWPAGLHLALSLTVRGEGSAPSASWRPALRGLVFWLSVSPFLFLADGWRRCRGLGSSFSFLVFQPPPFWQSPVFCSGPLFSPSSFTTPALFCLLAQLWSVIPSDLLLAPVPLYFSPL